MKAIIEERLTFNLERVEHLVSIYETVAGIGQGRRPPKTEDVLRAATVLLHASLEDFLRSIEDWRLPLANAAELEDIPLQGRARGAKFNLGDLAPFRGRSVEDLIRSSVTTYLGRKTYNNPGDVKQTLVSIGLNDPNLMTAAESLAPMMDRRHVIVHRADRNDRRGAGQNRTNSLARERVREWIGNVRDFGTAVLVQLP